MESLFLSQNKPRIAIIAGEASGDLLGSSLISALKEQLPDAEFSGIGGGRMLGLGFRSICPMDWLSVNGYVEVLRRLPKLLRLRKELIKNLIAAKPDVVIGIDAPDFNLVLERACKAAGIPTVHYVSPSVWAWRRKRIFTVQKSADHVLCLFPIEPPLYQEIGMPATFVGHPLADQIPLQVNRDEIRTALNHPLDIPVLAMLPGSRQSEVLRMGPVLLATVRKLVEKYPTLRVLVPLSTRETYQLFEQLLYTEQCTDLPITLMYGHAQDAMAAANVVLVKSGTSTLEAALMKRPMVITYKVAGLTAWLMKRKAYLPWVGLPNILANQTLVPELLQDQATAENLAAAVAQWFDDKAARENLEDHFQELHHTLRQSAAQKAARVILQLMNKRAAR